MSTESQAKRLGVLAKVPKQLRRLWKRGGYRGNNRAVLEALKR